MDKDKDYYKILEIEEDASEEEIKLAYPNEVEVIAPTEDETLTLYTCSGFNDEKRLVVVGKRI